MPITNKDTTIAASDGSGTFKAYTAFPENTDRPAPVLIFIQEIFGINDEMREKCHRAAEQGYIAICPDLFWRIEPNIELVDSIPEQLQRAFELFGLFDADKGMEDLTATLNTSREIEGSNGKVGCVGYCLGGMLAFRMATDTNIDAAVSYYGVAIDTMLNKKENIHNPLLLHIATEDEFVPKNAQEKIINELSDLSKNVQTYSYDGMNHAFARGNGMHYNEAAANLANKRTKELLESALK